MKNPDLFDRSVCLHFKLRAISRKLYHFKSLDKRKLLGVQNTAYAQSLLVTWQDLETRSCRLNGMSICENIFVSWLLALLDRCQQLNEEARLTIMEIFDLYDALQIVPCWTVISLFHQFKKLFDGLFIGRAQWLPLKQQWNRKMSKFSHYWVPVFL